MINLLPNSKGIDLIQVLSDLKNDNRFKHKRVLYVIQATQDKGNVTKFGIAGMDSGNPYSRLNEYVTMYGNIGSNACEGVKIFFLGVTEYNRLVEAKNSKVFKIEKLLKEKFSDRRVPNRGTERTTAPPSEVISEIKKLEPNIKDVPTIPTHNTREKTQKFRGVTTAYIDTPLRVSNRTKQPKKS
jgi:hypothetical protein